MVIFLCRTAGTLFGEGFRAFVTDWDKVTATVTTYPRGRPGGRLWGTVCGGLSMSLDPIPCWGDMRRPQTH
jgi:hypothetical protein